MNAGASRRIQEKMPQPLDKPSANHNRIRVDQAAVFILLLAFFLRAHNLGAESVWIDEGYSIALAQHSIPEIVQGTAADQHPPLYYFILHFWMKGVPGVYGARFLSLLVGMVYVAQIMQWGQRLGVPFIGLGAGLLVAISPMGVWYSQEARMYMLSTCLTTAATFELWLCLQDNKRWVRYGLFSLLAMYVHYFAIFILAAHAILVVAWVASRRELSYAWQWGKTMALCGLGFSIWVPTAIMQTRLHTMPWINPPNADAVRDALLTLLGGNEILEMAGEVRWITLAILGLPVLIALVVLREKLVIGQWRFGWVATWFVLPFAMIVFVSLYYPVFQTKQFLLLLGPALLCVTWSARLLPRRLGETFFGVVLLVAVVSLFRQQTTLLKDDWRGAALYIRERYATGDIVYGNPAASSLPLSIYWDSPLEFDGYPRQYDIITGGWKGENLAPGIVNEVMQADAQGHTRLWLVEQYPEFWDPGGLFEKWLNARARMLEDKQFRGVRVRLYAIR